MLSSFTDSQMEPLTFLLFFLAFSFLFFGTGCFLLPRMKHEFERYRLPHLRKTVGGLQLLGGAGLIFGFFLSPPIGLLASACLSILMLLGVVIRIKIKDPLLAILPALTYAILSAYLAVSLLPGL